MAAGNETLLADLHGLDALGVWSEDGWPIWLPLHFTPRRSDAIAWAVSEFHMTWPEVRCRKRWMRYEPYIAHNADGSEAWRDDLWSECAADAPGAFQVWRLEEA